jgi:hypothetical protein
MSVYTSLSGARVGPDNKSGATAKHPMLSLQEQSLLEVQHYCDLNVSVEICQIHDLVPTRLGTTD